MPRLVSSALVAAAFAVVAGDAHAYTTEEVARGREKFTRCASCHVLTGIAPAANMSMRRELDGAHGADQLRTLVTKSGRNGSVGELTDFILTRMPQNAPGTLTEREALDLTALLLASNGVVADGQPLTRSSVDATKLSKVMPSALPTGLLVGGLVAGALTVSTIVLVRRRKAR